MSKKIRYLLIAVGFAIFFILAPLIVMYVNGIHFNFVERQFETTGILSLAASPKDVDVYLNGKLIKKTAGNIKFLSPGEYQLNLKKDGYFDWEKRLEIKSGQVTWANPSAGKIYLFFNNPLPENLGQNIADFEISKNKLIYVSGSLLSLTRLDNLNQSQNINLPAAAERIFLAPDGQTAVLTGSGQPAGAPVTAMLADLNKFTVTDISKLFASQPIIKFTSDGRLLALENDSLYQIDFLAGKKNFLEKNVSAFDSQDGNVYFLTQKNGVASLMMLQKNANDNIVLSGNLPAFKTADLSVNFEKEVFVLLDQSLYQINVPLKKLADNVTAWGRRPDDSAIIFMHSGELSYYNPFDHSVYFITRAVENISNPQLRPDLNEAFYFKGSRATGIELDNRDRQNEYNFYTASQPQKLELDDSGKTLFILDGGNLKMLQIR